MMCKQFKKSTYVDLLAMFLLILCVASLAKANENVTINAEEGNHTEQHRETHTIHVASWQWEYVKSPLSLCIFVFFAGLVKLGFHHADFLSTIIPESCVLILLGTIVGAILLAIGDTGVFPDTLDPNLFFLYLLPPVILEAAYSLHDRVFAENFGTILIYAVIGTLFNCFIIGPLLYGLAAAGAMGSITINLTQALLFAALIVAVDPVAVLAIFQEVGVNNTLYFLVFGESLLNDAVTVVLYNTMKIFNEMDTIHVDQVFLGIANFFTVSLGGTAIGIIFGIGTAFMTKFTSHVEVVEPLALLILAYGSYLTAELFHFSGIVSMIACGLVQVQYAFHNVSTHSSTTVMNFIKMLGSVSDAVIFLFLGIALVNHKHYGHAGFIIWTLILISLVRFAGVIGLTFIVNKKGRVRKISYEEQFVMAYGGLRGAVCFSLVIMLRPTGIAGSLPDELRSIFVTTTLVVIIFTVFAQGITIKPLTKLLSITSANKGTVSLSEEINIHVSDHIMSGIEELIGQFGDNQLRVVLEAFDDKYFKRWLQRDPLRKNEEIMALYQEIALQNHYETVTGTQWEDEDEGEDDDDEKEMLVKPEAGDQEKNDVHAPVNPMNIISAVSKWKRRSSAMPDPGGHEIFANESMDHAINRNRMTKRVGGQARESKMIDNLTPDDLRRMLIVNPAQSMHQKAGRANIKGAGQDLSTYLQDKQIRQQRYKRHMSITGSPDLRRRQFGSIDEEASPDFNKSKKAYRSNSVPMNKLHLSPPGSPKVKMSIIGEEDEELEHRNSNPKKSSHHEPHRANTIDSSSLVSHKERKDQANDGFEDIPNNKGETDGNMSPDDVGVNVENQPAAVGRIGSLHRHDAVDKDDDNIV